MKMLTKAYVLAHKKEIIEEIKSGKTFVYPTDTIYGIGCSAINSEAVNRIRYMKKREEKPFSVIAPSIEWIQNSCETTKQIKDWIKRLPGPYTLVLNLKHSSAVAKEVNNSLPTLGVRIPAHWFYELIKESSLPFVTTSANISEKPYMTDFYNLDEFIKTNVDYVIYDGSLKTKPSTIVILTEEKEQIIQR